MNLSPFQSYVGIKTPKATQPEGMLLTDQDHPVDIALVDKDGEPVKSGEVEVSFYKVGWKWWWEKGYGDLADYTGRRSVNLLSKAKLPIEAGKAAWTIRQNYPAWGRYLLVARDVAAGIRRVRSSIWIGPAGLERPARTHQAAQMFSLSLRIRKSTQLVRPFEKLPFPLGVDPTSWSQSSGENHG